jgi:hypothetical protein
MSKKTEAPKRSAKKKPKDAAPRRPQHYTAPEGNGALTEKQVLALWELIITGDGKVAKDRAVELAPSDVTTLKKLGLVTVEPGPSKKQPGRMSKLHVTETGWAWANQQGFMVRLPTMKATAYVLEGLLVKVSDYLKVHELALVNLLRPRPADPVAPPALEERIRAAYVRVTGGVMNESIKLARLRDALGPEPHEAVDEELCQMQQRGSTVLYPIDDPQLLRPEDEGAALRIAGQRRDLVCIRS